MNPIKQSRLQEISDVPLLNEPLVSAGVFLKRALQAASGAAAKARQTLRSKVANKRPPIWSRWEGLFN
jgi:hypothetical protein